MTIHINGYTKPGRVDLWNMIVEHGGVYKQYLEGKTDVTHIIASNLTRSKQVDFVRYRVARPEWIVDSISAGRALPWSEYRLIDAGHNQRTLQQSGMTGHDLVSGTPTNAGHDQENEDLTYDNSDTAPNLSQRLNTVTASDSTLDRPVSKLGLGHDLHDSVPRSVQHELEIALPDKGRNTNRIIPISEGLSSFPLKVDPIEGSRAKMATKTAKDPDFIQDYFRNSRLHHLSTWKANLRLKIDNIAKIAGLNSMPRVQRYVMHVDFDCFFAAVSSLNRTDLKDKACAVTHGGTNSGEIASCNYKAREFGVKNGMWMKEAVKICPDIVSLPYEVQAYEAA